MSHFFTPSHQDIRMFTERYSQRENNLSLAELQYMKRLFMATPKVNNLVPAGAESGSFASLPKKSIVLDTQEFLALCCRSSGYY